MAAAFLTFEAFRRCTYEVFEYVFIQDAASYVRPTGQTENMRKPRVPARAVYVATVLALITFGAGYAFAALSVTSGTETGQGNYVGTAGIAWWSLSATNPGAVQTVPTAVPAALSTTVGTPTVLAGVATNYMIGAGTAGHVAQVLKYTELASAPANTEVEIFVTMNTGAGTTTSTVYVETQGVPALLVFTMFIDAGDASVGTVTINFTEQITQQCSAVGACP